MLVFGPASPPGSFVDKQNRTIEPSQVSDYMGLNDFELYRVLKREHGFKTSFGAGDIQALRQGYDVYLQAMAACKQIVEEERRIAEEKRKDAEAQADLEECIWAEAHFYDSNGVCSPRMIKDESPEEQAAFGLSKLFIERHRKRREAEARAAASQSALKVSEDQVLDDPKETVGVIKATKEISEDQVHESPKEVVEVAEAIQEVDTRIAVSDPAVVVHGGLIGEGAEAVTLHCSVNHPLRRDHPVQRQCVQVAIEQLVDRTYFDKKLQEMASVDYVADLRFTSDIFGLEIDGRIFFETFKSYVYSRRPILACLSPTSSAATVRYMWDGYAVHIQDEGLVLQRFMLYMVTVSFLALCQAYSSLAQAENRTLVYPWRLNSG